MRDINVIVLTGRLTRDAELKYTAGGTAVLSLSVAVGYSKKQDTGWVDETSYFDCVYFGKGAEAVGKYATKGQSVAIEGELRQDRWQKDGQPHSKVNIVVNQLRLTGAKQADKPADNPSDLDDEDYQF